MAESPQTTGNLASYTEKFQQYFEKEASVKAASTLSNGVEMEFHVGPEVFTFTREAGKNRIIPGAAQDPQLVFNLTEQAAREIVENPSEDIGKIGVHVMKLVVSSDANRRVAVHFKAGFLKLWSKGYFGVLKSGGSEFAGYLASRGLSGIDAIKAALGKLKQ